jgi:hypothetical protein
MATRERISTELATMKRERGPVDGQPGYGDGCEADHVGEDGAQDGLLVCESDSVEEERREEQGGAESIRLWPSGWGPRIIELERESRV